MKATTSPFFLLALCIVKTQSLMCQDFRLGMDLGVASNFVIIQNNVYTKIRPLSGFSAAATFDQRIKKNFYLQVGTLLLQKSYTQTREGRFSRIYDSQINLYGSLTFEAGFNCIVARKMEIALFTGGFVSYWLKSKSKGVVANLFSIVDSVTFSEEAGQFLSLDSYEERNSFNNRRDRRFEYGNSLLLRVTLRSKSIFQPLISMRFHNSFTDGKRETNFDFSDRKNRTFILSFGLIITGDKNGNFSF